MLLTGSTHTEIPNTTTDDYSPSLLRTTNGSIADNMVPSTLTGLPVLPSDPLKLDHVAIWDVYRQLGINYGDRVFARIMDADNENAPLENITWRKLLTDATKLAGVLKEKLSSEDGEHVTYGLLGVSNYAYYVNIVAGWLNHWTVRIFFKPKFRFYTDPINLYRWFCCPLVTVSQETTVY